MPFLLLLLTLTLVSISKSLNRNLVHLSNANKLLYERLDTTITNILTHTVAEAYFKVSLIKGKIKSNIFRDYYELICHC